MTQEDKELLLQDLCARLSYKVKVFYEYVDNLDGKTYGYSLTLNTWCIDEFEANKAVVKPYLRSMSSMTEEEEYEYRNVVVCPINRQWDVVDWLNANHFDFRGLIEKGLAIEALDGMYNSKIE